MARDRAAFALVAPDLADVDAREVERALADAALQVSDSAWGSKADLAVVLLAAHNLAVIHPELVESSQPVVSESIGPIHTSYARPAIDGNRPWGATAYGRRFLELRRTLPLTPFAI